MSAPTIAALEAATAAGTIDSWLAQIPTDALRSYVRRAIEFDRRLSTEHPASVASCLLARSLAIRELDPLRQVWFNELDARGGPWIRPLRAALSDGLLAELHSDSRVDCSGLQCPRFVSEDVLMLTEDRCHPTEDVPKRRRRDRLRWEWEYGTVRLEPDPDADKPAPRECYPRIETNGRGPAYLRRGRWRWRTELPCPAGGSAYGSFSRNGRRLYVYGTYDEHDGGFVYLLNPTTLEIEHKIETPVPVSSVLDCWFGEVLLLNTHRGLALWKSGEHLHVLPISANDFCLSPGGRFLATVGNGVRIWSIASLMSNAGLRPDEKQPSSGFPDRFDPSGDRLLVGSRLYEGRSGKWIADLKPHFGGYLEGGPARPWFHFGERYLISLHGGLRAWETRSGEVVAIGERLHLPQWYTVAYDRSGSRLAALHRHSGDKEVKLYMLPEGTVLATVNFDLEGTAIAMSADAEKIAVQRGPSLELRTTSGTLLGRFTHPLHNLQNPDKARLRYADDHDTLRFSLDGQHIGSFCEGDGWRIWAIAGGPGEHYPERMAIDSLPGFAAPPPSDWDIEADTRTVFTHRPSGTRIALPAAGPWIVNPTESRYLACDDFHIELRSH